MAPRGPGPPQTLGPRPWWLLRPRKSWSSRIGLTARRCNGPQLLGQVTRTHRNTSGVETIRRTQNSC